MSKEQGRTLDSYDESGLIDLLDKPQEYELLTDKDLDMFVFFAVGLYGMTARIDLISKIIPLYELYVKRIPPSQRIENYKASSAEIINGKMHPIGLAPYLCLDNDIGIVSTAALDYSVLCPLENDDPLTGPKTVIDLVKKGTITLPAAAIGGLLMLGDQRVMELLTETRHGLKKQDIEIIINCRSGYIFKATVDFYLDWLEELTGDNSDKIFGVVAAGFFKLIKGAQEPVVNSIERYFPSTLEKSARILSTWPLDEYLNTLRDRLSEIAQREKEPKVLPYILSALGLTG